MEVLQALGRKAEDSQPARLKLTTVLLSEPSDRQAQCLGQHARDVSDIVGGVGKNKSKIFFTLVECKLSCGRKKSIVISLNSEIVLSVESLIGVALHVWLGNLKSQR